MKRVFLGGTTNESTWRDSLIELLKIDYFNPVVDDWTEDDYQNELKERKFCDYVLYTITPRMTGVYSIAEVVDDSNKRPGTTLLCVLPSDVNDFGSGNISFGKSQLKSLIKVGEMVTNNGGKFFTSLSDVAEFLNNN